MKFYSLYKTMNCNIAHVRSVRPNGNIEIDHKGRISIGLVNSVKGVLPSMQDLKELENKTIAYIEAVDLGDETFLIEILGF